jgi:hypothetical protein
VALSDLLGQLEPQNFMNYIVEHQIVFVIDTTSEGGYPALVSLTGYPLSQGFWVRVWVSGLGHITGV